MSRAFILKIVLSMAFAFAISSLSINVVFVAKSPRIRPNLAGYLLSKVKTTSTKLISSINLNIQFAGKNNTTNNLTDKNIPATVIAKGVYAKSDNKISQIQITEDEVEWVVIKLKIKGKEYSVKYPKGDKAPDEGMLRQIYENN